jgi:hypothetical protein
VEQLQPGELHSILGLALQLRGTDGERTIPDELTKQALLRVCERSRVKGGVLSNSSGRILADMGVSLPRVLREARQPPSPKVVQVSTLGRKQQQQQSASNVAAAAPTALSDSQPLYRTVVINGVDSIAKALKGGNQMAIRELAQLRNAPSSEPPRFSPL